MAYNFLACDRDQACLLPPDVRDWLPADQLAWFVLDVVDQLDRQPFLAAHRADGHGRAAYEPRMLLGVLLYGYCLGVRSSRQPEQRCHQDIAFRVLAANQTPDHVTIARFRVGHQQALAGFLVESLAALRRRRHGPAVPGQGPAGGRGGRTPASLPAAGRRQRRGRGRQGPPATAAQVAAELTQDANDLQQLDPMLKATSTTLAAAGIQERPDTLLADSGYWSIANLTTIPDAPELGLRACKAEWKLCGTHNLLKLWRHTRRQPAPTPIAA